MESRGSFRERHKCSQEPGLCEVLGNIASSSMRPKYLTWEPPTSKRNSGPTACCSHGHVACECQHVWGQVAGLLCELTRARKHQRPWPSPEALLHAPSPILSLVPILPPYLPSRPQSSPKCPLHSFSQLSTQVSFVTTEKQIHATRLTNKANKLREPFRINGAHSRLQRRLDHPEPGSPWSSFQSFMGVSLNPVCPQGWASLPSLSPPISALTPSL